MWHAKARNVIERIFGVLKRRFRLVTAAAEYKVVTQAQIVLAVCCLHNFIITYDPNDMFVAECEEDTPAPELADGQLGGVVSQNEWRVASEEWDKIAEQMWQQYQSYMNNN